MKVKFNDPEFSFQFLRVLGSAASRQADVGECFATAERIVEGDFESWTREWTRTAERVAAGALKSAERKYDASAADAYLGREIITGPRNFICTAIPLCI